MFKALSSDHARRAYKELKMVIGFKLRQSMCIVASRRPAWLYDWGSLVRPRQLVLTGWLLSLRPHRRRPNPEESRCREVFIIRLVDQLQRATSGAFYPPQGDVSPRNPILLVLSLADLHGIGGGPLGAFHSSFSLDETWLVGGILAPGLAVYVYCSISPNALVHDLGAS